MKWAGGKRWLFTDAFIEKLPTYSRYIEPFLGGGAGFFALEPKNALISDINAELINLYCVMRDQPSALHAELSRHQNQHSKSYYYQMRATSVIEGDVERAGRTLYLNRTCWNGLYRLNRRGDFNVPIGTKNVVVFEYENFNYISSCLKGASIACCDFEETIDNGREGDLLFVDPPYTVAHNMNGFVKYNERIFSWKDQIRLRDAVQRAVSRGAQVVLTNADHESVREIYKGIGKHNTVVRKSIISGSNSGRLQISELMVVI